jgi:hypothetical protein
MILTNSRLEIPMFDLLHQLLHLEFSGDGVMVYTSYSGLTGYASHKDTIGAQCTPEDSSVMGIEYPVRLLKPK